MTTMPCDGCTRRVSVAGGIANLWSFEKDTTDGLTLELDDGSEHFLCFECMDDLPEEPTAADVAALPERSQDEPIDRGDAVPEQDGGIGAIGVGIAIGGGAGVALGLAIGDLEYGFTTGVAVGFFVALAVKKLRG